MFTSARCCKLRPDVEDVEQNEAERVSSHRVFVPAHHRLGVQAALPEQLKVLQVPQSQGRVDLGPGRGGGAAGGGDSQLCGTKRECSYS